MPRHLLIGLVLLASPAALAQGLGLAPLTDRFAICTGRFAALMEYRWVRDDPGVAETAAQLETMRELLAAVVEPGTSGLVLSREVEAKLAFERLLTRAERNERVSDADWARARADSEIATCTALILP